MNKDNQSVFNENDFLNFLKCKLDVKREGIWKIKYFFLHFAIVSFIRLAIFGLMCLFTKQSADITIWDTIQATNVTLLCSVFSFIVIGIFFTLYEKLNEDFCKDCVVEYSKQYNGVPYNVINQYVNHLFSQLLKNKNKNHINQLSYKDLDWMIKRQQKI